MSDIPSWAVRGAKVVCVSGFDLALTDPRLEWPSVGKTYTIREVRVRYVYEYPDPLLVGITLHEIENPICDGGSATGEEIAFHILSFRPVKRAKAEREQELEVV